MASGMRFVKRAVQSDLARFKAYVELADVKGLEYGHPEDEDASRGSSSGNGNGAKSSKEIEESRQERAERREQRRH
jgi:hypothetical protein